jgi:RNA polymerase sigma-70 factor, ECF subfamily
MARLFSLLFDRSAQLTDEQLIWRFAGTGDGEAFRLLHERWHGPIHRLCLRMTGDEHRAEDLRQETFARVFRFGREFANGRKFSTWLWRIALNLCHDELRRRQRRPEVTLATTDSAEESASLEEPRCDGPSPAQQLETGERHAAVRAALLELPEHYRSVVVLRHYENLRFAEIAGALDIPEGTVKSRMAEALKQLNTRLALLETPARNHSTAFPTAKAACL